MNIREDRYPRVEYCCRYCGESFGDNLAAYDLHKVGHLKDYSTASNEEIAMSLKNMAEDWKRWHRGEDNFNMPYKNFVTLLDTAAERLELGSEKDM